MPPPPSRAAERHPFCYSGEIRLGPIPRTVAKGDRALACLPLSLGFPGIKVFTLAISVQITAHAALKPIRMTICEQSLTIRGYDEPVGKENGSIGTSAFRNVPSRTFWDCFNVSWAFQVVLKRV